MIGCNSVRNREPGRSHQEVPIRMLRHRIAPIVILFGCALLSPAFAASYITFSVPGAVSAYAGAINSNGDVAGAWLDANQQLHGFIRTSAGIITTFDLPPMSSDEVFNISSINIQDQVAGIWSPQSGGTSGFLVSGGVVTTFTIQGSPEVYSAIINDSGAIAGNYYDSAAEFSQGYILASDGSVTTFTSPTGYDIYTVGGFNDNGDIAGTLTNFQLFLRYSDGSFSIRALDVDIPAFYPTYRVTLAGVNLSDEVAGAGIFVFPFGPSIYIPFEWTPQGGVNRFTVTAGNNAETRVAGINDSGEIVGVIYALSNETTTGFLRASDGTITLIQVGSVSTFPTGINNPGVICGSTITADSNPNAVGFLYTP
jgi:hypothetical protein